jgi:tRNA(fMet)-specific endonuclease VapC
MQHMLIDTNIYTAFMAEREDVVETLCLASRLVICPTVAGELLAGFKAGTRERANREEWNRFLDNSAVAEVTIDSTTAEFYAEVYRALRAKGTPIPTNDMWIAATALQNGLPLATLDGHFRLIDGLVLVPF